MKRVIAWLAAIMLLILSFGAYAEGMGVQVIGGPDVDTEPVSLDDIKINEAATMDGYGVFNATGFTIQDVLGYYAQGKHSPDTDWWYRSGNDAEFAILKVDITNLATKDKEFLQNATVKVVFDDTYEYGGWAYQINYDNSSYDWERYYGSYNKIQNVEFVIDDADKFPVGPMYTGHYFFGCTLPNAVINSKAPLRMEINLDGNEITYNIRK